MVETLRPLNVPRAVQVREAGGGLPAAICQQRRWQPVAEIIDIWRIDDEWWRQRPISRMYYQVVLEDGKTISVFKDLVSGRWYRQQG